MAIELLETSEKTAADIAHELEIPADLINRWRRELSRNESSFQGKRQSQFNFRTKRNSSIKKGT